MRTLEETGDRFLMTHAEYKEMLAEYALGALEASETHALEAHLATCDDCRAELAVWCDTTATIAYSVNLVEPPPAARARLLENIRALKAEPSNGTIESRRDSGREVGQKSRTTPGNVIAMPERSRSRWSGWQRFGALAASLAFAAFIITLIVFWNRNKAMQADLTRLNKDLQTTQEQLKHDQEVIAMFTAPDTKVMPLNGTAMAPQANARLAYNKAGSAMMIVNGLQPAPAGKDYQIWFIVEGKPMPGGVFQPDAKGHVEMRAQLPAQALAASAFVVTLEPQGGTQAPTGEKYLLSTASS